MNKKSIVAISLLALFVVTFHACNKDRMPKYVNYESGYYPFAFGRYVIYDVDSTLWDDFLCVKTVHKYQMRYGVTDTFRDAQFRLSYRIDVDIRRGDTLPWNPHRVYYATPTATRLEFVEENLRYFKLVYPMGNGITWKGNAAIPAADADLQYFQDWNYTYKYYSEPFNDGKVNFPNTITVEHVDEVVNNPETLPNAYASKTFSKEVYGFDIGMVYREMTHWEYQPDNTKCRFGYSVVMRAVEHN